MHYRKLILWEPPLQSASPFPILKNIFGIKFAVIRVVYTFDIQLVTICAAYLAISFQVTYKFQKGQIH